MIHIYNSNWKGNKTRQTDDEDVMKRWDDDFYLRYISTAFIISDMQYSCDWKMLAGILSAIMITILDHSASWEITASGNSWMHCIDQADVGTNVRLLCVYVGPTVQFRAVPALGIFNYWTPVRRPEHRVYWGFRQIVRVLCTLSCSPQRRVSTLPRLCQCGLALRHSSFLYSVKLVTKKKITASTPYTE